MKLTMPELKLVSLTVWGEARGEPKLGQAAVAWVIRNRAEHPRWWGTSVAEVILRPWQFSCWQDHIQFCDTIAIRKVCEGVFKGKTPDPTHGADHYCRTDIADKTYWTHGKTPTVVIGNHSFYRLEL